MPSPASQVKLIRGFSNVHKQAPFAPLDHPARANGEQWRETFGKTGIPAFQRLNGESRQAGMSLVTYWKLFKASASLS